ncbi:hypothetical protein M514_07171 [Trichuris suis]|uniref:Uncharacterized protein n=1 Tax=Trichuris suis TaxID=68888 RepID=A0A085M3P6_9BILA|nr:hypothetical protein M513_07171 [Trichuris suis]KFD66982.1 hypothetical protein M514_07171 [Trichuris suis]
MTKETRKLREKSDCTQKISTLLSSSKLLYVRPTLVSYCWLPLDESCRGSQSAAHWVVAYQFTAISGYRSSGQALGQVAGLAAS